MKKNIKIFLIAILLIIGVILLDTIQARIFKNSPLISFKETLEDSDIWVKKGLLMDTYYCTKEKDIITVYWKLKTSKFTCPIDNELNERNEKLVKLLKEKMIEDKLLDETNLETFDVFNISTYGYYKNVTLKKYIKFNFKYSCKDKKVECIKGISKMYSTISSDNDYYIIYAYTDEDKIYELSNESNLKINEDFVFTNQINNNIGLIN